MKNMEFSQLGLVGHWKFNEGTGSVAKDSSPEGNDGTIHGASWTNDEQRRMCLYFDGSDDYVNCGNNDSLNIPKNFSWSAWFYVRDITGDHIQCIISKVYISNALYNYLGILDSDRTLHFRLWNNSFIEIGNARTSINPGQWYHAVGVYDSDAVKLYVNGELKHSNTNSGFGDDIGGLTSPVHIGSLEHYDRFYFNGVIDEVRIYNRALSAEEILAHYSRKKYLLPRKCL